MDEAVPPPARARAMTVGFASAYRVCNRQQHDAVTGTSVRAMAI